MEYIGMTCPYCKTKLAPGDEVAICSTCEMPHHMECWRENQGCTTFGCTGTIQAVQCLEGSSSGEPLSLNTAAQPQAIPAAPTFCTICNQKLRDIAQFCPECGTPVARPAGSEAEPHPQPANKLCLKCGNQVISAALFCNRCGTRFW